jgi:hypothetical protein
LAAGAHAAPSEEQARAARVADEVTRLSHELNRDRKDLVSMAAELRRAQAGTPAEYAAVSGVDRWANEINWYADEYARLMTLASAMESDHDEAVVLKQVRVLYGLESVFDRALSGIDAELHAVQTPALIAQAVRIKADITRVRATIRAWSP